MRFVADILEQRQPAGDQQFGDLLDQPRLLHLEGNFGDDDLIAATAEILDLPLGAHAKTAAARLVGLDDGGVVVDDDATGRKVGAGNELDQLLDRRLRMLDEIERRIA